MKKMLLLLGVLISTIGYSQEFEKGKEIFTTNCAGCHAMDKRVVGPPLENTIEAQGRDWTSKWISNSGQLIQSGDAHATEIYNEYNQMAMPAFNYLKPEELNAILDYMEGFKKDKETKAAAAAPATPAGGEATTTSDGGGLPIYLWIFLILTLALLVAAGFVVVISIRLIASHATKIRVINQQLMKKLNIDDSEVNKSVDKLFDEEVSKRVKEKVKTLKSGIDDNLKNFK